MSMIVSRRRPRSEEKCGLFAGGADTTAAEREVLSLADYVYTSTSLKPVSKTLFFISRLLLVEKLGRASAVPARIIDSYNSVVAALGDSAPPDDYQFADIVSEAAPHLEYITARVRRVVESTAGTDALGLVFNSLLRGKFQAGEGLGTFLTPEEVVGPMLDMLLTSRYGADGLPKDGESNGRFLFGDVCGGTGRFVFLLAQKLLQQGMDRRRVEQGARLFDQSSLAVGFAQLNFAFDDLRPAFRRVADSATDTELSGLRGAFSLLATNPPFGTAKYRWTPSITESLPTSVLAAFGLRGPGTSCDPAEVFLFRNLDLLCDGGALAIVLPDGVLRSESLKNAISEFESARHTRVAVDAVVSLPVATFALGGTVAKTSFAILRRGDRSIARSTYTAAAEHIGFLKKGNRRVANPHGNDLDAIAADFAAPRPKIGRLSAFLSKARTTEASMRDGHELLASTSVPVSDVASLVRTSVTAPTGQDCFHVSVLDVDETGLIDILATTRNQPITKASACAPGDCLVSCINPKIWRVTVIPPIKGEWTCSGEFAVLRPKPGVDPWRLAACLHSQQAMVEAQGLAWGTSSSRQRVRKSSVLQLSLPWRSLRIVESEKFAEWRKDFYITRLREGFEFARLHAGELVFGPVIR